MARLTAGPRRVRQEPCVARINTRPDLHDPLTHYVVVRSDLPLGVLAAQIVHAAGESSPGNLPEATRAVVLTVAGEEALERLFARLARAQVAYRAIREPEAPWNGALMAIGVVPAPKSTLRKVLSDVPLYRGTFKPGTPNEDAPARADRSRCLPQARICACSSKAEHQPPPGALFYVTFRLSGLPTAPGT